MTHPLLFIPVAYVACIICVGIKRDTLGEILLEGTRFFVLFTLACVALGAIAYFICVYLNAGAMSA